MVFTFEGRFSENITASGNKMKMAKHMTVLAGLLAVGAAFGDAKAKTKPEAKAKASAGQMQVEEPSVGTPAAPAIVHSAKISKEQRAPARGLSAEQKQAFRDRKEKMQQMITLITEKRRALQAAKPEERAALARELHSMILERDPEGLALTGQARVAAPSPEKPAVNAPVINPPASPASAGSAASSESQSANAKQEDLLKQQQERLKEKWQRKLNSKDED